MTICKIFIEEAVEAARGLSEMFFPRKCVVCGCFLDTGERDICGGCLEELPLTYHWDIVQNAAFERLARRFEVQDAASLFFFGAESDYRNILYGIKYGGRREFGRSLGRLLGRKLADAKAFGNCHAVVPVPLHPLRQWKRGYNQAEEIARGVAEELGLPVETGLLKRHRRTRTQTKLHGEAKSRNVQGAFSLNDEKLPQLLENGIYRLLLIDDVLTTGSTLAACAAPLLEVGFSISVATLAFSGT